MTAIDVQSVVYIYEGEETALENIPPEAHYACHKFDGAGETAYIEQRSGGYTRRITCYAHDEPAETRAASVLAHALQTGATYHEVEPPLALGVIVPQDRFEADVPVEETDTWEVTALFTTRPSEDGATLVLGEPAGYLVEVLATQPVAAPSKMITYNPKKALQTIEYILLSTDDNQQADTRVSFFESTDPALSGSGDDYADGDERDVQPFPVVDQAQRDEAARYVSADHRVYWDLDDNPIRPDELAIHQDFRRRWVDKDERLAMHEIFLSMGIAQTEVFDIPRPMHRRALHAYLRKLHAEKALISTAPEAASHYVVFHEPLTGESTEAVALEDGQLKRRISVYTLRGVFALCQCMVLGEDQRLLKKLDFSRPDEQGLVSEEIFEYDAAGEMLRSSVINH